MRIPIRYSWVLVAVLLFWAVGAMAQQDIMSICADLQSSDSCGGSADIPAFTPRNIYMCLINPSGEQVLAWEARITNTSTPSTMLGNWVMSGLDIDSDPEDFVVGNGASPLEPNSQNVIVLGSMQVVILEVGTPIEFFIGPIPGSVSFPGGTPGYVHTLGFMTPATVCGGDFNEPVFSITGVPAGTGDCVWHDATMPPLDNSQLDGHGVAWGDYDGDGDDDLFLANNGPNKLLRNGGGGNFTDVAFTSGDNDADSRGAAWGDYDNDGDLDLYVVNWDAANVLYRNNGGTLVDATAGDLGCTLQGNNAAWADYDLDGDLDLFIANYDGPNKLLNNDGGVFTMVASAAGFTDLSRGCAWGDYDNDTDPDLYVSVQDGPNHMFQNDNGVLVDVTLAPLDDRGKGKGVAWGDYDNDGDLDLYLVNRFTANRLFINDGGLFTISDDAATADEGDGRACGWGDYNNDGWLDLFVTNYSGDSKLLHNQGGVSFVDSTCGDLLMPITAWGMGWNDYDGDGDLDLYVTNRSWEGQDSHMFRNDLITNKSWLRVELEGTISNRGGIGAKVVVSDPVTGLTQMREISAGSGYMSQQAAVAQFGLADADLVDLTIYWPSGVVQTLSSQPANQRLVIVETASSTGVQEPVKPVAYNVRNHPNPFNPLTTIEFSLPKAGPVTLRVYNLDGHLVKTLLSDAAYDSGTFSVDWNGTDADGRKVASGVFLYRFKSGSHDQTGRMVLMK